MIKSTDASRLDNRELRDSLVRIFRFLMITFLVLFAVSLFIQIDISATLTHLATEARNCIANQQVLPPGCLPSYVARFEQTLDVLRVITLALSLAVAPLAVYTSIRYDLQETSS